MERRRFIAASATLLGVAGLSPAALAELLATPRQSRGPFYPAELPLDQDNDLVTVAGGSGMAKGDITHIAGRVVDGKGRPVRAARIEIWQCNAFGRYHHPRDHRDRPLDPNFQGYGQFVTGPGGAYRFRTIRPVPYPGRAPHIHFAISGPDFAPLVTQMYVAGAPENDSDLLLNGIRDRKARESLIVSLERGPQGDDLVGRFDIVLSRDRPFERRG